MKQNNFLLLPLKIILWVLITIGYLTKSTIILLLVQIKLFFKKINNFRLPKFHFSFQVSRKKFPSQGALFFNRQDYKHSLFKLRNKKTSYSSSGVKQSRKVHLIQNSLFNLKTTFIGKIIGQTIISILFGFIIALTSIFLKVFQIICIILEFIFKGIPVTLVNYLQATTYFFTRKRYKKLFRIRITTAILVSTMLILGLLAVYSFYLVDLASQLPSPTRLSEITGPLTTTFYDRNGKVLYRLYDDKNRQLVKLSDLSPYLIDATISIEDKNFYKHHGVDITGIIRAAWMYFQNKEVTGGSTITQQLIKNTLLTPERTIDRKIKEIILAFWTESIYTKDQILTMYFNEAPYGGQAWGIAAASQMYFGKNPKNLTLAESAYLAGLTASPTTFSPYGPDPNLGKQRQKEVLRRMVEEKYITTQQARDAASQTLTIKPPVTQIQAPHFVMYLKQLLDEKYGARYVSEGGLQVYTTLDLNIQKMAENVVKTQVNNLASLDVTNGAAMVTDPRTGQILAMVGSKDYWDPNDGNFNVTLAPRQPGSSIKVVTYATAFEQGLSPGSVILDAPTVWSDGWSTYAPVNYDGRFHGLVTLRTALGSSFNIPAVKVLQAVGIPNMIKTAHDMGITTLNDPQRYGLSLTLGSGEVKLIDMMSVYGTLAQMGIRHDIQPIIKIVDPKGNIIEDHTNPESTRVLPDGVAYMVSDVLSDNNARTPAFGPNSLLVIPNHTVAVKTGTTDDKRDNWTFGYTPDYVVGVWVGNNDNHPMNQALTSGITGAAPIWHDIMTNLLKNQPNIPFQRPSNVVEGLVDGNKDLVLMGVTKNISTIPTSTPSTAGNLSLNKNSN